MFCTQSTGTVISGQWSAQRIHLLQHMFQMTANLLLTLNLHLLRICSLCFCCFQNASSQFFFIFFHNIDWIAQQYTDFQNYLISIRKSNKSKKFKHLKRWIFCRALFFFFFSFFLNRFILLHGKKLVCKQTFFQIAF